VCDGRTEVVVQHDWATANYLETLITGSVPDAARCASLDGAGRIRRGRRRGPGVRRSRPGRRARIARRSPGPSQRVAGVAGQIADLTALPDPHQRLVGVRVPLRSASSGVTTIPPMVYSNGQPGWEASRIRVSGS
jgi:NADPH:quinone reductase-like Zn-dependent oxidoreductase